MNRQAMKKKNIIKDLLPVIIGELAVSAIVSAVGFLLGLAKIITFDYRIITGALLGAAVMVANYTLLVCSVDNQIDKFVENRGKDEMDDEEAKEYANKYSADIQKAIGLSSTVRTVSMLITLVIAFLLDWFNPIATAIPMLCFRLILPIINRIISKDDKAPDPSKFIKYDYDDENKNEKEDE